MKSYFKFLKRNKSLTLIQVLGISIALSFAIPAVSLLVELWQMDHDNPQYKNIYGVITCGTSSFQGEDQYFTDTYPEVEDATQFISAGTGKVVDLFFDDKKVSAQIMFCNPDIEDFFPLKMQTGSIASLDKGNSIILSKEFAGKLSDENLMGKSITIDEKEYVVGGILDAFESQRIPYTDVILSLKGHPDESFFSIYTFIRLRDGEPIEPFAEKIRKKETKEFAAKLEVKEANMNMDFERYDQMSVTSDFYWLTALNPDVLIILGTALLLLLVFAFSNYTNLSMAMTTRRAKEMAIKQLLGSTKWDIWKQVLAENVVFTAICFIFGLLLASASMHLLSTILSIDVPSSLLSSIKLSPVAWMAYAMLIIVMGILTGLAPARAISRYSAIDVVKGEFKAKEKKFVSKALIVLQGIITVVLLFVTILEWAQIKHNGVMDFGCDIDEVYTIQLPSSDDTEKDVVFQTLSEKSYVTGIGYAEQIPGTCYESFEIRDLWINYLICDPDAFQVLGFRKKEDYVSRGQSTLWISDNLKDQLMGKELTGEELSEMKSDVAGGVIEAFLPCGAGSFRCPVAIVKEGDVVKKNYMVLRTKGNHHEISLDIEKTMNTVLYEHSGKLKNSRSGYLREQYYNANKKSEEQLLDMMQSYVIIMMVLSLLGILGISTYNMQIRKHDIAIRKVFGSSTHEEMSRNTRSYSMLMLIANVVGLPLGYLLGSMFQENEISKVGISPWMFIATFLFTMGAVICVCLIQSYYTACLNPVENLKSE